MKAYFEALAREDVPAITTHYMALSASDKLRVMLCNGAGGIWQFGFRAEVGRA